MCPPSVFACLGRENSEWNPTRLHLAFVLNLANTKGIHNSREQTERAATDVIQFWGPDTGRDSNIFHIPKHRD